MKRETYESRKAFAGEKKPSMQRRCVDHDYTGRMTYMLTMTIEGRRPLLGQVVGRIDAPAGSEDAPRTELSTLGQRVHDEWWGIPRYYPQVEVRALQIMPDHLHGILFVREKMEVDLSRIIRGFKTGCNRHYRELFPNLVPAPSVPSEPSPSVLSEPSPSVQSEPSPSVPSAPSPSVPSASSTVPSEPSPSVPSASSTVPSVVTESRQTSKMPHKNSPHGLLFAHGFNDKLLLREGQLRRWLDYLHDNPRRLLIKRMHPDLFRVHEGVTVGEWHCSAVGNMALLTAPTRLQVRISRSISPELLATEKERFLSAARAGAVLVSPSISPGEKLIMRAAFDERLPVIALSSNGIAPMQKPSGERFYACAEARLLILSPFPHTNNRTVITREACNTLNALAWEICRQ